MLVVTPMKLFFIDYFECMIGNGGAPSDTTTSRQHIYIFFKDLATI